MIQLEHVEDLVAARNFQKLMALVLDTGGRTLGLRIGTGTLTWPGATPTSTTLTVSHGLGKTPLAVFPAPTAGFVNAALDMTTFTYTGITFDVNAVTSDGSLPALGTTKTFVWAAFG